MPMLLHDGSSLATHAGDVLDLQSLGGGLGYLGSDYFAVVYWAGDYWCVLAPPPIALPQTFRKALRAKLLALPDLTAVVGSHVYPDILPTSHDLGTKGPAVVYSVTKSPLRFSGHGDFNHTLSGSDGTISALVLLTALSYTFSDVDYISVILFDEMDGIRNASDWGDGTTTIMSCIRGMEIDLPEPPTPENPRIVYRITDQYYVRYRVALPVNS